MKTIGMWTTAACLLSALAGGTAYAQDPSFVMANNTQFTIYSVYIWPVQSDETGPDRLGNATIESGDSFPFEPDDGWCMHNIRVSLGGSDYQRQWNNVNLCGLSLVTVNYNYVRRNLTASIR